MIVVNLFGAPGAGKSTGAAYVFSQLKLRYNVNAELVTEFAKDKVWEDNAKALDNQAYVFGEQSYRISKMNGKVDVVVTDSPLLLSKLYNSSSTLGDSFNETVVKVFNSYSNMNYFINRVKKYNPSGRLQTEEQSDELSKKLFSELRELNIPFTLVNGDFNGYNKIVEDIMKEMAKVYTEQDREKNGEEQKIKVLALFGPSGAGKDYLKTALLPPTYGGYDSKGKTIVTKMGEPALIKTGGIYYKTINVKIHNVINCTTRPKREKEKDGESYLFLTPEEFASDVMSGEMVEATSFNDWCYGTRLSSYNKQVLNIGVYSIEAISCLLEDNRFEVYPVYVSASPKTRLLRQLNRQNSPDCKEICRRYLADEKDFQDIPFDYLTFNAEDKSSDDFYGREILEWAEMKNLL